MNRRLPRAASATAAASLPPVGLDGLDVALSRVVDVPESGTGRTRGWHVLDTGPWLGARGIRPVGTVLCVHGNPTWSYLWRGLVTAAIGAADAGAPAWRVLAVDQLEMGFSERTGTPRDLARRVWDLGDLTDALELDGDVITLGHDWGGVVSLGWAVDHAGRLAGVMLLNTAVHQPEGLPIPWPLRLALASGVLGPATVGTPSFIETTLALAHPALSPAVKEGYRAPYRTAARRGGIGGFVADIPAARSHGSRAELDRIAAGIARVDVPALMLWGPRDPIFGDRHLDDLIDRMPHADVHRFEGAGHLLAEDVDYATAVLDWLSDGRSRPPAEGFDTGAPSSRPTRPAGEAGQASSRWSSRTTAKRPPVSKPDLAGREYRPLWHFLDELRDSRDPALIEMAPPSGSGRRTVSWHRLSLRVRQLAVGLHEIGVRKGDRVSLLVQPGADLTAILYACVRIGAIVVVADAGLGLRGLTRAVRGAQPDYLVGSPVALVAARALGWDGVRISTNWMTGTSVGRALKVEYALADLIDYGGGLPWGTAVDDSRLPPEPAPDDTAAVLFTSGSTGPAKGVVYTHAQLSALAGALSAQYDIGVGTGLVAGFAPFALLGPALGARSVTPDMDVTSPRTLTATAVAEAVALAHGTVLFLSPAAIANVVATAETLSSSDRAALSGVRTFLSAGAPVSVTLLQAASDLMPAAVAHTPYGMTEGLLMTDASLDEIRGASPDPAGGVLVGRPVAGVEVRIAPLNALGAATGAPVTTPGATGEILVSAAHLGQGYDRLALTDRVARHGTPDGGRWHRTGDVGHLDSDGRLWVEGRLPHVIAASNGPITPVGPEQRIETVGSVQRGAVVGVGPAGTQQVVAVIETVSGARRSGLAHARLAASVRAASPVPLAAVLVTTVLPTDIRHNSKIDRARVARWAARVLSGGRMSAP